MDRQAVNSIPRQASWRNVLPYVVPFLSSPRFLPPRVASILVQTSVKHSAHRLSYHPFTPDLRSCTSPIPDTHNGSRNDCNERKEIQLQTPAITPGDRLLRGALGHLTSDNLDLVHIQNLSVIQLERRISNAEGPHLFAEAVVFQVTLYYPPNTITNTE